MSLVIAGWLATLLWGVFLTRNSRTDAERLICLTIPIALWAAIMLILSEQLMSTHIWNLSRIIPPLAFLKGHPLYPGIGETPLYCSTPYPPVAFLIFLPAALAKDPIGACLIGQWVSILIVLGPAWKALAPNARGSFRWSLAAFLTLVLVCFQNAALKYGVSYIHADAPAIGFALLSCLCLAGSDKDGSRRSYGSLAGAAVFLTLAVWSRQVFLALAVPLVFFTLLQRGKKSALTLILFVLTANAAAALTFCTLFGSDELFVNLIAIPYMRPWWFEDKWRGIVLSAQRFFEYGRYPILMACGAWILVIRGGGAPQRQGFDALPQLLLWVGLTLLPIGIWTGCSLGASMNHYAPSIFFIFLSGIVCALMGARASGPSTTEKDPLPGRPVLAAMLIFFSLAAIPQMLTMDQAFNYFRDQPLRQACDYDRTHPGEVYFPWSPIVPFMNSGRMDHFILAVHDRELGGYKVGLDEFAAGIPPQAKRWAVSREAPRVLSHAMPGGSIEWYQRQLTKQVELKNLDRFDVYEITDHPASGRVKTVASSTQDKIPRGQ